MTPLEIVEKIEDLMGRSKDYLNGVQQFTLSNGELADFHTIKPYLYFLFSTKGYKTFMTKQKLYFDGKLMTMRPSINNMFFQNYDVEFNFVYRNGSYFFNLSIYFNRVSVGTDQKFREIKKNLEPIVQLQRELLYETYMEHKVQEQLIELL